MTRQHLLSHAFTATIASQVLSSLSNFFLPLALARGGGSESVGAFGLFTAVYLIALGGQRALLSEPLLSIGIDRAQLSCRQAVTCHLGFAGTASLLMVVGGLISGEHLWTIGGAALFYLLTHDALRSIAFATGRPGAAVTADAVWTAISILGMLAVFANPAPELAIGLWGIGALGGTLASWSRLDLSLAGPGRSVRWWWHRQRRTGSGLALESAIYAIGTQGAVVLMATAVGLAALGDMRSAQILVAPALLVLPALGNYILPRAVGRLREDATSILSQSTRTSLIAVASVSLLCLPAIGVALLGITSVVLGDRVAADDYLAPVLAQAMLAAAATGPVVYLKATGQAWRLVWTRAFAAGLGIVLVLVASRVSGVAVAWALSAQNAFFWIAAVGALWASVRHRQSAQADRSHVETGDS